MVKSETARCCLALGRDKRPGHDICDVWKRVHGTCRSLRSTCADHTVAHNFVTVFDRSLPCGFPGLLRFHYCTGLNSQIATFPPTTDSRFPGTGQIEGAGQGRNPPGIGAADFGRCSVISGCASAQLWVRVSFKYPRRCCYELQPLRPPISQGSIMHPGPTVKDTLRAIWGGLGVFV